MKTFEDLDKQRKEQHRIAMIEFRLNKKHKRKEMQSEHRRLERTMKWLVRGLRLLGPALATSLTAL